MIPVAGCFNKSLTSLERIPRLVASPTKRTTVSSVNFESVKQGVGMFGEAGMQMMLKSLGIDPKQLMEFAASLKSVVEDLNKRLQTIENQQKEIKALLESLQVEVRDE